MDDQRYQLFGKLARPIVIGAIGRQRWQPISVVIRAHEMIGSCFGCRIWAVRRVRSGLRKWRISRTERTIDFVGRYMQEAKALALLGWQRQPIRARGFEQRESAYDVGGDEVGWTADRSIDVAFRGEVEHRTRAVLVEQRLDERAIGNVATDEQVPRIAFERRKVAEG